MLLEQKKKYTFYLSIKPEGLTNWSLTVNVYNNNTQEG